MAYACPVCETPQADGRHLANHLAFTAMIHGDDHEAWLDEHAPEWERAGEKSLAERVAGQAAETDLSAAIEDPTEGREGNEGGPETDESASPGHHAEDDHPREAREARGGVERPPTGEGTPSRGEDRATAGFGIETGETGDDGDERDVAAIVAEARELTERMHERTDTDAESGESEDER
jgi:hypothetical protein